MSSEYDDFTEQHYLEILRFAKINVRFPSRKFKFIDTIPEIAIEDS